MGLRVVIARTLCTMLAIAILSAPAAANGVRVPNTTVRNPLDIGVRAHTNHLIVISPNGGLGPAGGVSPSQMRSFYGMPANGGGGVIAIVGAYDDPTALADFNTFSQQFGLPQEPSANPTSANNAVFQVIYQGGTQPAGNLGWSQEEAMDVEWAHAMAPNAKIVLVEAQTANLTDLLACVDLAVAVPGVREISMSWGGAEFAGETGFDTHFNLSGPFFFASTGDTGGVTEWPSTSPYVVAVGGTSVATNANGVFQSETGWSSGGGGDSAYETKPAWQSGVANTGANRSVPDISSDADPATGASVYAPTGAGSAWQSFGGTSLSAPCMAGMANLEAAPFANTTALVTYVYARMGTADLRDITSGNNGFSCLAGWDFVTGVGAPQGNLFSGAPVPFTMSSPANFAVTISTSATYSWNAATGATSYHLQVSSSPNMASPVVDLANITATSVTPATMLTPGTQYYWQVYAVNASGQTLANGAPWAFTTWVDPSMANPTPGTNLPSSSVTFTWNPGTAVSGYWLQVGNTLGGTTYYNANPGGGGAATVNGLPTDGTTVYVRLWWIHTGSSTWVHQDYTYGSGSVGLPGAFNLAGPANNSVFVPTTPTYSWTASAGATSYHLQVSSNATFSAMLVDLSNIVGTSVTPNIVLNIATVYYWRVFAVDASGSVVAANAPWSFETPSAPQAFNLSLPANGATNQSTTPMFTWTAALGATSYELEVSTSPNFAILVDDVITANTWSQPATVLAGTTSYYWQVIASDAYGQTVATGAPAIFTTQGPPGPFNLISPANNATSVLTNATFMWNPSLNATSYHLQVSTSPTFAANAIDVVGINSTTYTPGAGLGNATVYYWRVYAVNGFGQTLATAAPWTFTTIGAPGGFTLISPSNGANAVAPTPTYSWSGALGATGYHLQVSTTANFSNIVVDVGNFNALQTTPAAPLSYSTTYYWQVTAIDGYGQTLASGAPWSFTTQAPPPPPPGAFTLIGPSNGATGQGTVQNYTWNVSAAATTYTLQVSTTANMQNLVVNVGGIGGTSYQVGGLSPGVTYYWSVTGVNVSGQTVASGAPWWFTTSSTPVMNTPVPGSVLPGASVTFTWSLGAGVTQYWFQVGSTAAGTNYYNANPGMGGSAVVNNLPSNGSMVYVRLWWLIGTWSYRDYTYTASVAGAPGVFALTAPANAASAVTTSPTYSWNASAGATSYHLQVSTSATFSSLTVDLAGLATTSSTPGTVLGNSTLYYWRVYALNANGQTVATGAPWSFTTQAPPQPPGGFTLSSPAYSATSVSTSPTYVWNASAGATSYHLQVSASATFSSTVVDIAGIGTTSAAPGAVLGNSTAYYWRVYAVNGAGQTLASGSPWVFTTMAAANPPGAFTLVSPANGATGVTTTPTYSWNASAGATSYHLQVSASANMASPVVNLSNISTTSVTPNTALGNSTVYYWQVYAVNANGQTLATNVPWSFTTTAPSLVPGAFALSSPANAATGVATSPTYAWSASAGATSYHLQVSTSAAFANTVVDLSGLTSLSLRPGTILSNSTVYYWRVYAVNANGQSLAAGAPWSFTTSANPSMASPVPGSHLGTATVTFTWSLGNGVSGYWLQVGSIAGGNNYYNANPGSAGTVTVGGLPTNGSTVYVRLWWSRNGSWAYQDYTYVAGP